MKSSVNYEAIQAKVRDVERELRTLGYKGFIIAGNQSVDVHQIGSQTIAIRYGLLDLGSKHVVAQITRFIAKGPNRDTITAAPKASKRSHHLSLDGLKLCSHCREELPLAEFNKKADGLQSNCRRCNRAISKARRNQGRVS